MENELIKKAESPLAVYSEFRQQLEQLKKDNAATVFHYDDPAGAKEARSHIYKLRRTKGGIDDARKAEKAESLRYGRVVDAEAKDLIAEVDDMIEIHAKPLREIAERETDRIQKHKDQIEGMKKVAGQTEHPDSRPLTAEEYRQAIDYLERINTALFDEFSDQATTIRADALAIARRHFDDRTKYEADQAELARLQQEAQEREARDQEEKAAREKAEREERLRKEGEELANKEAQKAAAKQAEHAEAERIAAENRELELKLAAETAEREKHEAIQRAAQAENDAKVMAEQSQRDRIAQEAAASRKREANKRHRGKINNEALKSLVAGGIDEVTARACVVLIAEGKVKNVKINY